MDDNGLITVFTMDCTELSVSAVVYTFHLICFRHDASFRSLFQVYWMESNTSSIDPVYASSWPVSV